MVGGGWLVVVVVVMVVLAVAVVVVVVAAAVRDDVGGGGGGVFLAALANLRTSYLPTSATRLRFFDTLWPLGKLCVTDLKMWPMREQGRTRMRPPHIHTYWRRSRRKK
jgi:hypothetical protein